MTRPTPLAVHESAHAVIASLLGFPLTLLTVEQGGGCAGRCVHQPVRHADAGAAALLTPGVGDWRACIVVALAGEAALRHTEYAPEHFSRDRDQAWALARRVAGDTPERAYEVAAEYRNGWETACGLTSAFWVAISDVARSLTYSPTMEGAEAQRVVKHFIDQQRTSNWEYAREQAHAALATYLPVRSAGEEDAEGED